MNSRYVLIFGTVLIALLAAVQAPAQNRDAAPSVASAKGEAIARMGIIRNPSGRDAMVARAIYVKLRKGYGGDNPPAMVGQIASQTGIRPASTSHLAFSRIPLGKDVAARIQKMSPARQAKARAAEDELSRIVEVHYTAEMLPADAARLMERLPQVEYAEPIYLPYALGGAAPPNDPRLAQQFQLNQARVLEAWNIWKGDTNMVIAVVDAGIDMFHEDLAPNIKENPGETGLDALNRDKRTNGRDDDTNGVIDDWRGANLTSGLDGTAHGDTKGSAHGTQVAGLAAAMPDNGIGVAGSGYHCRFFPIKAAANNGGPLVRAYEGILYAAREGYQVINCSFGSDDFSKALEDLIANTVDAFDCAIIAGAGNAVSYGPFYPAGYRHVLGVGAIDRANAFQTSWGEQVGINSPGGYSTSDGNEYTDLPPATSYSTPLVAGVVGLVRSKWPTLTADQAIAHVRLTADANPDPNPAKGKLTGYGRLNALRAVSTDPFSHPAISIDTVWIVDDNGVPQDRAPIGKVSRLRVRLRNILGNATNIKVRVVNYTSDSAAVSVTNTALTHAQLGTDEVAEVEGTIPFQVKQPSTSFIRLRFEITADNSYSDYHYERMLFYRPYITFHTPKIDLALTDNGRIGYADYPGNEIGTGFFYDASSFLYEGGFMVAKNVVQVQSNVRNGDDSRAEMDFGPVEYPSASNNYTLTLNDAPAGDMRIGLELRIRVFTADTVPDGVGIELRTKNITTERFDSLRVAMFTDWDIDNSEVEQSLDYVEAKKSNVPFYGLATGSSGYYVTHGVAAPAALPVFYAIRNDSLPLPLHDGFDETEKWRTMSNGVGSRTVKLADSSDISLVIGKRIVNLEPGAEDTTIFVIGISNFQNIALKAMRDLAPKIFDSTATGVEHVATGAGMLRAIMPNPFSTTTAIAVTNAGRDARLLVYDAMGRIVTDLSDRLPLDGNGTVLFDGSALPSGVYQVQLISGPASESQRIVLMR